jgi:mannose-6-phosphate isomerase-like protein (cupin superfamily)
MIHVRPGAGATVTALGSTYTTKTDGDTTKGAYSLVEEDFWGDPTPLHRHLAAEEAFYVLSGHLAIWDDGADTVVDPGAYVVPSRRRASGALNGHEPVRMLTLISPRRKRFFKP